VFKCLACGATALRREEIVKVVSADPDLLSQQIMALESMVKQVAERLQRIETNSQQIRTSPDDMVGGNP